jgi:hypothetical protein
MLTANNPVKRPLPVLRRAINQDKAGDWPVTWEYEKRFILTAVFQFDFLTAQRWCFHLTSEMTMVTQYSSFCTLVPLPSLHLSYQFIDSDFTTGSPENFVSVWKKQSPLLHT